MLQLVMLDACLTVYFCHVCSYDKTIPDFLRPFTAFSVYTRILNQGVELLQRRKDYQGAVSLLRKLLGQRVYCVDYRGHWWERLALNYDAHLKNSEKVPYSHLILNRLTLYSSVLIRLKIKAIFASNEKLDYDILYVTAAFKV